MRPATLFLPVMGLAALALASCGELQTDHDGDGYTLADDCNDWNPSVNPEGIELCDGLDNDCDGAVDEESAADATIWYADFDGDGFGDANGETPGCAAPVGAVANADDCNDADPAIHPGAPEPDCSDPVDYNCDDSVGFADADLDGAAACVDCNDADDEVFPDANEFCDGKDNDCNGLVDEGAIDELEAWADLDGDGWGGPIRTVGCDIPRGFVTLPGDCDDLHEAINPDADEVCDEIDNDCDDLVDEDVIEPTVWWADSDNDGFGDPDSTVADCVKPASYVDNPLDCDDGDITIFPGADEYCSDEVDNDCDGEVDESDAVDAGRYHPDRDADGYGDARYGVDACEIPSGYVSNDDDCNDVDARVSPSAIEDCSDGVDNDCSGTADDC